MVNTGAGLISPSNVVKMSEALKAEVGLDGVHLRLGSAREDLVYMRDHGLDVCRAILRHVPADGLEVVPEVAVAQGYAIGVALGRHGTTHITA